MPMSHPPSLSWATRLPAQSPRICSARTVLFGLDPGPSKTLYTMLTIQRGRRGTIAKRQAPTPSTLPPGGELASPGNAASRLDSARAGHRVVPPVEPTLPGWTAG
ncbi:uncharacterized protein N7459_004897 [Penicillium hispanicum]|uniref:uncharacterized protein n=1 Tax=Penicillium hispanicum TaxID=1080232 RepID=UPI002541FCC7|nr:uncharacterized protein N7459_004897 [Penicillium hispanicum]KAJ5585097.1 hypothetical protein N7459_004897 [Penicillium hispanicum]